MAALDKIIEDGYEFLKGRWWGLPVLALGVLGVLGVIAFSIWNSLPNGVKERLLSPSPPLAAASGSSSPPTATALAGSASAARAPAVERPLAAPLVTPIASATAPQAPLLAKTVPPEPLTASSPKPTVQDLIRQIKQSGSAVEKAALKAQARSLLAQQLDFGTVQLDNRGTHTTLIFKSYDPATNVLLLSERIQLDRNQISYTGDWCTNKEKCSYSGDLKIDLGKLDRLQTYTDDGSFELGCWFSHQSSNTKCITPIPVKSTCPITRCSESENHANSILEPRGSGINHLVSFKRAAGTIIYDIDGRPPK